MDSLGPAFRRATVLGLLAVLVSACANVPPLAVDDAAVPDDDHASAAAPNSADEGVLDAPADDNVIFMDLEAGESVEKIVSDLAPDVLAPDSVSAGDEDPFGYLYGLTDVAQSEVEEQRDSGQLARRQGLVDSLAGVPARVSIYVVPAENLREYRDGWWEAASLSLRPPTVRQEGSEDGWPEEALVVVSDLRPSYFDVSMMVRDTYVRLAGESPATYDEIYDWAQRVAAAIDRARS